MSLLEAECLFAIPLPGNEKRVALRFRTQLFCACLLLLLVSLGVLGLLWLFRPGRGVEAVSFFVGS